MNFLAPKLLFLYYFLFSAFYTHFRGKTRLKPLRQLFDHSTFMAPINFLMYAFSKVPNQPFIDHSNFPQLHILKDNWVDIKEEATALLQEGLVKASNKYDDLGFNSFFRKGWKRFYLKWYEDFLPSANHLCPKTIDLLSQIPGLNAAMFTFLPAGSNLVLHRDPYAGSLRYHLGLITPNSEECRIFVDGIPYSWRDGEDVIFDETYLHLAENKTDIDRLILFCDLERPMRYRFATTLNRLFSKYVMRHSATQNLPTDKVGFLNRIFKYLYVIRMGGKKLKTYNRKLYYFVKYSFAAALVYWIFG